MVELGVDGVDVGEAPRRDVIRLDDDRHGDKGLEFLPGLCSAARYGSKLVLGKVRQVRRSAAGRRRAREDSRVHIDINFAFCDRLERSNFSSPREDRGRCWTSRMREAEAIVPKRSCGETSRAWKDGFVFVFVFVLADGGL